MWWYALGVSKVYSNECMNIWIRGREKIGLGIICYRETHLLDVELRQ